MRRVLLSNLDGRSCWRDMTVVCSILSLAAVATAWFIPRTAAAQGNRTKVTCPLEFREVSGFPPLSPRPSFPLEFPTTPPHSIWILTVRDRRP